MELYLGRYGKKLRFFTPDGTVVPTPAEVALQVTQGAVEANRRADRFAAQLRSLGVEPDPG